MMPSRNSYVSWYDVGVMPPVARVLDRVLSVSPASLAPRDPKRLRGFRWFQRVSVVGFSGRVSSVGSSGFEWVWPGFAGFRWVWSVVALGVSLIDQGPDARQGARRDGRRGRRAVLGAARGASARRVQRRRAVGRLRRRRHHAQRRDRGRARRGRALQQSARSTARCRSSRP